MFNGISDYVALMANVVIKAKENGPLIVESDGNTIFALCRCGASQTKPSCDGSHAKIGFRAESTEINIFLSRFSPLFSDKLFIMFL